MMYRLKKYSFRNGSTWWRVQMRKRSSDPWRDSFDSPFRGEERREAELYLRRLQAE